MNSYLRDDFPDSPYICRHTNCQYHSGSTRGAKESCDYFFIEGETKHSKGVTDWHDCPLYKKGKKAVSLNARVATIYDWNKAMRLYEKGVDDAGIAAVLGCARDTVKNWRFRHDLPNERSEYHAYTDESHQSKVP